MKDAVAELSRRSRISIWSRFNVVLGAALAVGLVIAITYRNLPWVKEKSAQDARATELTAKLEYARMQNQRLTREVSRLQTDPEFLAVFARDRVMPGYMKPGETIFRIERNERTEPPSPPR